MFTLRPCLEVRKATRLHQLREELEGLYMAGACCSTDATLERVTRQVIQVHHNMERVRRVGRVRPPAAGLGRWLQQLIRRWRPAS